MRNKREEQIRSELQTAKHRIDFDQRPTSPFYMSAMATFYGKVCGITRNHGDIISLICVDIVTIQLVSFLDSKKQSKSINFKV